MSENQNLSLQKNQTQIMSPKEIVSELNKHVVGQNEAKRSVAIALRNRWRRSQVGEPLRSEITPKNILMIGPTGVGKTEIARRLARLANAPFIKIEATKFTEVGFVGRDVDTIIRDLVDIAFKKHKEEAMQKIKSRAEESAEEKILDILLPSSPKNHSNPFFPNPSDNAENSENDKKNDDLANRTREKFRQKLRNAELDDKEIEIEVKANVQAEVFAPPGMEEISDHVQGMLQIFTQDSSANKRTRKMKIKDAKKQLTEDESVRLLDLDEIKKQAVKAVEQNGIVFLDEIDKITSRVMGNSAEVSRQGVQRDLLPLVEGTTVSTKHGMIKTDHILFIASGAFHLTKPSDLIPELQGRFPIRVELKSLSVSDFEQILTQTDACLIKQYQALLATEKVNLNFTPEGIHRIAEIAWNVNEKTENIGARRLHTVMEKLLEEISFTAGSDESVETLEINVDFVNERLKDLSENEDLSRYVL